MSNQTPLNPDGVDALAFHLFESEGGERKNWDDPNRKINKRYYREIAGEAARAYLAAAQLVVNSVEELITTRAGLALANAAFNEGLSAGIRACNESLEGEPFVKPVSPYRSEVDE